MPWPVRLVPTPRSETEWRELRVGDLYPLPHGEREWGVYVNAPEHAGKEPLLLVLPCGTHFPVYGRSRRDGKFGGGWQVSGAVPALTLTPSINIGGGWHGYVQDGVISDDVEGRTFPPLR